MCLWSVCCHVSGETPSGVTVRGVAGERSLSWCLKVLLLGEMHHDSNKLISDWMSIVSAGLAIHQLKHKKHPNIPKITLAK